MKLDRGMKKSLPAFVEVHTLDMQQPGLTIFEPWKMESKQEEFCVGLCEGGKRTFECELASLS